MYHRQRQTRVMTSQSMGTPDQHSYLFSMNVCISINTQKSKVMSKTKLNEGHYENFNRCLSREINSDDHATK